MNDILKRQNAVSQLLAFWALQHVTDDMNRGHGHGRNGMMLVQGQGKILLSLMQEDHVAQKNLADKLGLTAQSTAEFVKKLEQKDYVTREKLPSDRRVTIVSLTELGRQEANNALQNTMPFLQVLSDEELDQLTIIVSKINKHLYDNIAEASPNLLTKIHQFTLNRYLNHLHDGELSSKSE